MRITLFVAAIIGSALTCPDVRACECAKPGPPCEAIGQSSLVFLGTVTEIRRGAREIAMRVDRSYKGGLGKTIELFDGGMCDGPRFELGHQYLMYTEGLPSQMVPARGCTRSRRVEDAQEDLEFLKSYSTGKVTTHISGTVRFRPDEPDDTDEPDAPLKDVRVTLTREKMRLLATTDASGRYSFLRLSPGEYEIEADLPGYRVDFEPDTITLQANGCAQADLLMRADRRVEGVVRDRTGGAGANVRVDLVATALGPRQSRPESFSSTSDGDGRYVIDGISPGEYYLGINLQRTPTKEYPYAPSYYPSGTDAAQAARIVVGIGGSVQQFDLRVGDRLPLIQMNGRVLNPDGTPPREADRPQVRFKEPGVFGQIEREPIKIDSNGRFQFQLCEGVRYSAYAFAEPAATTTYSAPVEFVPTKENNGLELILNKTSDEFQKLRRDLTSRK